MEDINYKELLRKYICHVGTCEGTTFTGRDLDDHPDFTFEEITELRRLAKGGDDE